MEHGAIAVNIHDELIKLRTSFMFLTDTTMLWWRNRCDEIRRGANTVDTWDDFVREFRDYFFLEFAQQEARSKLHRLEQRGAIREYMKEFTELKLQIRNLSEEEALRAFMDGLKPWALLELKRRDVNSLARALCVAKSLVDLTKAEPRSRPRDWRSDRPEDEGRNTPRGTPDQSGRVKT